MKIIDKILFKTTLASNLTYDDLKTIYKHNIGRDYIKGYIGRDYLSLYFLGNMPMFLGVSKRSVKVNAIPFTRFTIDRDDFANNVQPIEFKATWFILFYYFLILIFAGMLFTISVLLESIIHAGFGTGVIIISYALLDFHYKFQLEQFENDLKTFTKYYLEKTQPNKP